MKVVNIAPHLPDFEEIAIPVGVVEGRTRTIYTRKADAVDLPQHVALSLLEQEDVWAPADAASKAHVKAVKAERARIETERLAEEERQRQEKEAEQAELVRQAEASYAALVKASQPNPPAVDETPTEEKGA